MDYPDTTMLVTVFYKEGKRKECEEELALTVVTVNDVPEGFRHLSNSAFDRLVIVGSPLKISRLSSVDIISWRPLEKSHD